MAPIPASTTSHWYISPSGTVVVTNPGSPDQQFRRPGRCADRSQRQQQQRLAHLQRYHASRRLVHGSIHRGNTRHGGQQRRLRHALFGDGQRKRRHQHRNHHLQLDHQRRLRVRSVPSTPATQTTTEGTTISTVSINASDSTSGATMYYMAFGLPPGLKISPTTGAITGTVAIGAAV